MPEALNYIREGVGAGLGQAAGALKTASAFVLPPAAPFTNIETPNKTCMFLIILYVFLILYKKEVMSIINKFLK